jgi:3-oxoacyl-[acyl-carrier protein] reductase
LIKRRAEQEGIDYRKALANSAKNLPVGYLANPDEFAQLAVFLCSPNASYITGTAIAVDGGFSKGLY